MENPTAGTLKRVVALALLVMSVSSAGAATIPGPTLTEEEDGWDYFGLHFRADADVTLISVRYPNQGGASTILLQSGFGGATLVSVPVLAGNPDITVPINYALVSGADYTIVAVSNSNNKFSFDPGFEVGAAGITVLESAGCSGGGCPYDARTDFWASFNDIQTSSNCGNGVIGVGEQCDNGAGDLSRCCSSTCQNLNEGNDCNADDGQFCVISSSCVTGTCIGLARDCADSNPCTQDPCNEATDVCEHLEEPAAGCMEAPAVKFQVTDSATAGKDKMSWQWKKGAGFDQGDLGAPLSSTTYSLCVYDTNVMQEIATTVTVASSPTLWVDKDPKGFLYKDPDGTSQGATKLQLKTGVAGKGMAKFSAGGPSLLLPGPDGAKYFENVAGVTVQLVASNGLCWNSSMTEADTSRNDEGGFKAQKK